MIRVLHVIGAMDRAGAETMIMNYYRHIDREKIQFDFLVHTDRHCDYDDEIESLGGNLYRIPRFNGLNYLSYKKACREFFEAHPEIDIVHGHIESCASIYLPEAHKAGKATICHSHNTNESLSINGMLFHLATSRNKRCAEYYMACSKEAGLDRFGSSVVKGKNFSILPNAIELEGFSFDASKRNAVRSEFRLHNQAVYGHIGRFTKQKNHPFLIDVFSQIRKKDSTAQLLLVGKGEDEQMIRHLVEEKDLDDSVHFLGIRNDIAEILSAIDVFLFPSLWEGLGVALIEAQASGLPCIVSDAIPDEAVILPTTKKLPLSDPETWTKAAIEALNVNREQTMNQDTIAANGYEIDQAAEMLVSFYRKLLQI